MPKFLYAIDCHFNLDGDGNVAYLVRFRPKVLYVIDCHFSLDGDDNVAYMVRFRTIRSRLQCLWDHFVLRKKHWRDRIDEKKYIWYSSHNAWFDEKTGAPCRRKLSRHLNWLLCEYLRTKSDDLAKKEVGVLPT